MELHPFFVKIFNKEGPIGFSGTLLTLVLIFVDVIPYVWTQTAKEGKQYRPMYPSFNCLLDKAMYNQENC